MGGIVSAITGSGANKAASAQAAAAQAGIAATQEATAQSVEVQREALKQQREMFDKALELGQPYRLAGQNALTQYVDLLNGTGDQQLAALEKTPGYQFQLEEGTKALERGAAARSGVLSGAQTKALQRYGQGLASTSYNSFMDRIGSLATMGQNTAVNAGSQAMQSGATSAGILQGIGNTYTNQGNNVAQLQSQIGAAQASGYLGQQQAGQQMLGAAAGAGMGYLTGFGSLAAAGTGASAGIGALLSLSDKRTKENIRKVGKEKGHNIYRYNYKGGNNTYEGVLAQEVEKKRPDAVIDMEFDGKSYKTVDYKKLGLEMRRV